MGTQYELWGALGMVYQGCTRYLVFESQQEVPNEHVNKEGMCTNEHLLVYLVFVNKVVYKLFLYLLEKSFAKLLILLNVVSFSWRSWISTGWSRGVWKLQRVWRLLDPLKTLLKLRPAQHERLLTPVQGRIYVFWFKIFLSVLTGEIVLCSTSGINALYDRSLYHVTPMT